jgi:hypothetical protein
MLKKLKRLQGMTLDELLHRVREQWRRETDRMRFRAGFGSEDDPEFETLWGTQGFSFKDYLRSGPAQRFYSSTQNREAICAFFTCRFPAWFDRAIEEAGHLSHHRVDLLGHINIHLARDIDWHRDPVSAQPWPQRYWADYDLVHSSTADSKVIHELNRQQYLPRLAKAFFLTGDEDYACEAVGQMESWIDQNPKWNGVNWQSSLEISIRVISWVWTLFLLLSSESLDERATRRICKSVFAQLDHVYRYPSLYSSPNTHLIGEATALFVGGLLFPELPRADKWRQFASIVLVSEMQRQVSDQGVYCELSSYYHCYATDFFLQVMTLARQNRLPFPDWMWNRLSKMLDFVLNLTRPDGSIPLLGDDDGGRALALSAQDYRSFRDALCSGAVLFNRGDFKHQASGFREESLWLLGEDSWPIFNSIDAQPPSRLHTFYPNLGYFFQRSGWGCRDCQVIFDCGGLGEPTGGHGHADALSLTLFSGGREILIDPGTSVYNCSPEWRSFFRSTHAHNTVVVDDTSQSEPNGTFAWKKRANARVVKHFSLPGIEYIDGEHDGYSRLQEQVTHRRRLVYIRPNYWIVLDELQGTGEHDYEFLYHFAPNAELLIFGEERRGEVDCRARIKEAVLQMFMYASGPLQAEAVCGQVAPIQGWSSHCYGERKPSPVLRATLTGFAPVGMMSFLIPGEEARPSRRFESGGGSTIGAAVRDGDYDDIAIMSMEGAELHLIDCVMRGEFFWLRTENGALKQLLAVNARSFKHAGETIFESPQLIPYVTAYFWENGIVIERGEQEGKVYVRDLRDRQFQRN